MRRLGSSLILVGVAILGLSVLAFVTSGQAVAQMEMPAAEAPAVWEYITKTNPYTTWGTWPDAAMEGYLQSGAPHSKVVKIFVNDIGLSVASKFPGEMPEGTMIVKDNYMGDSIDNPGALGAVTIMYKVQGYNPDGHDWFWAKIQPNGTVDAAGKPAGCIGCHLGIPNNKDGVLRWGFEAEPAVASAAGSPEVAKVMQKMQQPKKLPVTGEPLLQNLQILAAVLGAAFVIAGYTLRRKFEAS